MRRTLRREDHLVYAITDFDLSIMFPNTAAREECRLPSKLSWAGGGDQPNDTSQGELDYDPFAYDVGCLGVLFCHEFQVRFVRDALKCKVDLELPHSTLHGPSRCLRRYWIE